MKNCIRFLSFYLVVFPASLCAQIQPGVYTDSTRTDVFLEELLKQQAPLFDSILTNRKRYNVQVIYTKIDRGANGIAGLKHYYFNVNAARYFYPASVVKLPVAILAMQRLNELKQHGLDKNTTMLTEKAYSGQTAVYNDPTTPAGKPNIAHYIKKMFLVSDNDACNRLYEFLGQQYINDQMHQKGYAGTQLLHRLQEEMSMDENRHTNPVKFVAPGNKLLYEQPMQVCNKIWQKRNDKLGKAFMNKEQLVNTAMDFSSMNRISLEEIHSILISLVFPNKVTSAQRFGITEDDRKFLLKYMSQLPAESIQPPYIDDTVTYYPAYGKYLLYGAARGVLNDSLRIFNKVGKAYGNLIDVAYVVDFEKKIEFFLSAVIYCNNDGVVNDDKYDYDTIGFPFMKNLGKAVYEYETRREKKILPDLSELKFEYEGR